MSAAVAERPRSDSTLNSTRSRQNRPLCFFDVYPQMIARQVKLVDIGLANFHTFQIGAQMMFNIATAPYRAFMRDGPEALRKFYERGKAWRGMQDGIRERFNRLTRDPRTRNDLYQSINLSLIESPINIMKAATETLLQRFDVDEMRVSSQTRELIAQEAASALEEFAETWTGNVILQKKEKQPGKLQVKYVTGYRGGSLADVFSETTVFWLRENGNDVEYVEMHPIHGAQVRETEFRDILNGMKRDEENGVKKIYVNHSAGTHKVGWSAKRHPAACAGIINWGPFAHGNINEKTNEAQAVVKDSLVAGLANSPQDYDFLDNTLHDGRGPFPDQIPFVANIVAEGDLITPLKAAVDPEAYTIYAKPHRRGNPPIDINELRGHSRVNIVFPKGSSVNSHSGAPASEDGLVLTQILVEYINSLHDTKKVIALPIGQEVMLRQAA